jgi:hypothetical protein
MSQINVNNIYDGNGTNSARLYGVSMRYGGTNFVNRIINGDMRIDQRNAGASVTPTNNQYCLDRFVAGVTQTSKFSVQQSTTAPVGFTNSMLVTSLSAYSVGASDLFMVSQLIEGFNCSDFAWGTPSAQPVTLSFKVRSSLTGTFGGVLRISATATYPFTYAIASANTWTDASVTIPGYTGAMSNSTTNGVGLVVRFSLGAGSTYSGTAGAWTTVSPDPVTATGAVSVVGTSGATFYITGVQLEAGSVATPFERRPYGTELALCQRYAVQLADGSDQVVATGQCFTTSGGGAVVRFPVEMRAAPTITASSAAHFALTNAPGATAAMSGTNFVFASTKSFLCELTGRSGGGLVAGDATTIFALNSAARLLASAEL